MDPGRVATWGSGLILGLLGAVSVGLAVTTGDRRFWELALWAWFLHGLVTGLFRGVSGMVAGMVVRLFPGADPPPPPPPPPDRR